MTHATRIHVRVCAGERIDTVMRRVCGEMMQQRWYVERTWDREEGMDAPMSAAAGIDVDEEEDGKRRRC